MTLIVRLGRLSALSGAFILLALPVRAWNKEGHMIAAWIAHDELRRQDPAALKAATEVLRAHPSVKSYWRDELAAPGKLSESERLFMLAARWPDDIRGDPKQHRERWHYINRPFSFPDVEAASLKPKESIVDGYGSSLDVLNSLAARSLKSVSLCWVLHLVGDVHQPLHTSALVSPLYPKGDRGGGLYHVRETSGAGPAKLHAVWDRMVVNLDEPLLIEDFEELAQVGADLLKQPAYSRSAYGERLKQRDFEVWIGESFRLSIVHAYRKGDVKGSPSLGAAPVLPADYLTANRPIAEKQLVLAGLRLADLLAELY